VTVPLMLRRTFWRVRDRIGYIRWVLAGRPPVHVDCSLTDISVPYTTSTMSKAEQAALTAEWTAELDKPGATV
jgi:hypothetical protein